MTLRDDFSNLLTSPLIALLVLIHLLIPFGGFVIFQIGRIRFVGLFLYASTALLVFDGLLYWWFQTRDEPLNNQVKSKWLIDFRIAAAFVALTVVGFVLFGRGMVAYAVASVAGATLLYRACLSDDTKGTLALVFVFGMVLFVSRAFSVYYLIPTFDTIKHVGTIKAIVEAGGAEQFRNTRFDGFLVYHIYGTIVSKLTGVVPRLASKLLFTLAFPAAALGTFAFVRRWGNDERLALVATVVLALTPAFLEWGTKAHYQSLSFVYLPFAALSMSTLLQDRRFIVAGIPVILAWIYTHHFSVVMAITMLALPLAINAYRSYGGSWRPNELIAAFFVAVTLKWTVLTSWFRTPIVWIMEYSPIAEIGEGKPSKPSSDESTSTPTGPSTSTPSEATPTSTPTPSEATPTSTPVQTGNVSDPSQILGGIRSQLIYTRVLNNPKDLFVASLPFFADYLYLAFLLALSVIGILTWLRERLYEYAPLIVAGSVAAYFYFPNPLWLPLRGLAEFPRWDIIAAPFVAVFVAAGLLTLVRRTSRTTVRTVVTVVGLFGLVFAMISSGFFAPTTSDLIGADRYDRQYLTEEDVQAGDWTLAHASSSRPIYATSKLLGYLGATNDPLLSNGPYTFKRARVTGYYGTVIFDPGLTVFQREAFRTDAVKMKFDPAASYYPSGVSVTAPLTDENIKYAPETTNLVYNNGETVVHWTGSDNGTHSR